MEHERHHHEHHHDHQSDTATFARDIEGLPEARVTEEVALEDGDTYQLQLEPVRKRIGDSDVRMLAYNRSIPGPTLRVRQDAEVQIDVLNEGDLEATVHWHGLRLDNRYDGTHETQAAIPIGGSFSYRLAFPDPGVYWYHPHIREDYGQEMGLYGNILVQPSEDDYWPTCDRELLITLDDILLEDGAVAPFSPTETNYVAMGRFGNVLLIAGQTNLALDVQQDEIVRVYLTNTANTRVFNVALPGAQMKLVGGDSGRCEQEELVESVILAPSERVAVDVLFDQPAELTLEHRTPETTYTLASITVTERPPRPDRRQAFLELRRNPEWAAEREHLAHYLDADPDKTLAFVAEMEMGSPDGAVVFACPMHPEVISASADDRCPKCGMKLLPTAVTSFVCPMHPEIVSANGDDRCPKCGMKLLPAQLVAGASGDAGHDHSSDHGHDEHHAHEQNHGGGDHPDHAAGGIEWEDDMVEVNRITTPANTRWQLVDRPSGAINHAIDWHFHVGERVKIRLVNEMDSDHPMHHPFHVHGAGRFVVLARDGRPEPNLVWKDTVLVRTGQTVDILLDVTNVGVWMAHCHIAEHHESGMMFSFTVTEPNATTA